MLVDVGAGTVDVALFNVHRDRKREEDAYPIFDGDVLYMGTHFLMKSRVRAASGSSIRWDDLQAIPSCPEAAALLGVDRMRVEAADLEFQKELWPRIGGLLHRTRMRRYGRAPEWREGLPIFISGGGSSCQVYRQAIAKACHSLRIPYKHLSLPILDEALSDSAIDHADAHRFAVAYGLTFDADLTGRIFAPREIEDAPRYDSEAGRSRARPDRDDLYPK
jgi:hypothetical protein